MGNPPDPPKAGDALAAGLKTAEQQQGFNQEAWLSSMINQQGPWGSLQYTQTGTTPEGNPIMTATTKYSQPVQTLFDQLLANKDQMGGQAHALMAGRNYGAANPEDVIGDLASGITGGIMDQYKKSLDPFFATATDQLHTSLSNRGLIPGTPAYDNAMRQLQQSQGLQVNNLVGQTGTKAYELASGMYRMPAELALQMAQFGSPASAAQDFTSALPQQQPANLIGATANAQQALMDQWKAETKKYGDLWGGVGNIGSSLLGGWASSPAGGAAITSGLGSLGSMFMLSDRRYKTDIEYTGEDIKGIPVYSYRHPWETQFRLGVMAQEVEELMPDAVITVDDVKFVDYGKILGTEG